MRSSHPALVVGLGILIVGCSAPEADRVPPAPAQPHGAPPAVRSDPAVVDDYHGTKVADPYRWLEDQDGAETADFVARQNAATRAVLDAIPERAAFHDRLAELWNFPRRDAPLHRGTRWFQTRNDGLQNQDVVFVADGPAAEGEVLLDPNTWSDGSGTVALGTFVPTADGSLAAYSTSAAGSDWQTWHVLDVAAKKPLPDELVWTKFTRAAWTKDAKGFFYQRYPAPQAGQVYEAKTQNAQLCYHVLGTAQQDDRVVYERPDEPGWNFGPEVTDDGRYLIVTVRAGTARQNRIAYVDLREDGWPVKALHMQGDGFWDFLGNRDDRMWFRTDLGAPNCRIVESAAGDDTGLKELVPEQREALGAAQVLGGHFVLTYLTDASSRVAVHTLDGAAAGAIALPGIGTLSGFQGSTDDPLAFATFASFTQPPTILQHDFTSGETRMLPGPQLPYDPQRFVTERQFLQSGDGTRLCLFLVHEKGLRLDGRNPTYLYGYGGFNIAMTPRFSVPNLVFVERGGIYAQAVLRGGSEYGEAWHQAGMLGDKQHVFDDFVACAEFLIRNGYTSTPHLAIGGGSNGGLLVGACLVQHPELFGAAIPEVGVMDMLRYHTFTIGHAWASEYGRSDDEKAFAWLHRYSPLHNIHPGTHYPPTLVMTGDHDDRVLPGHSYKFAATLQQAQGGPAPILLRIETSAGHGAGKPLAKRIDEAADRWAFLAATIGRR